MIPRRVGRLAYQGAYLALRAWSGVVRPHTRGVKCLLLDGERVLLVRHSYGPGDWDLPGGFCRRGEPFGVAARREIAEELGVRGARFTDVGELRRRWQGRHETLRAFRVEAPPQSIAPQSLEVAEVGWFPRSDLPQPLAPIVHAIAALDAGLPRSRQG